MGPSLPSKTAFGKGAKTQHNYTPKQTERYTCLGGDVVGGGILQHFNHERTNQRQKELQSA